MSRRLAAVFLTALLFAAWPAAADIAQVDPTFGGDGTVEETPPCTDQTCIFRVSKVLAQPDGKVLVFAIDGRNGGFLGQPYFIGMRLTRRLGNGEIDTSFGNAGVAQLPFYSRQNGGDTFVHLDGAVALQADGKILAGAIAFESCESTYCPSNIGLARLMPDGSLDAGFGSGGSVRVGNGTTTKVFGLSLQADGKIVVASRTSDTIQLARFTTSGAVDTSYGNNGAIAAIVLGANPFFRFGFGMHPDGRATVATSTEFSDTIIARVTASGQMDTSFGGTGDATFGNQYGQPRAESLVVAGDGSVYLAVNRPDQSGLMHVFDNGSPDASFGLGGVRLYPVAYFLRRIGLDEQGRIVGMGAYGGSGGDSQPMVVTRYLADGSPDTSLRGTGYHATPVADGVADMAMAPGGKALVVRQVNLVTRFGVVNALEDNGEFVRQQFRDFLAREPDAGGLAYWTNRLATDLTRAQLVTMFLDSPEFGQAIAPIARLYFSYFMRFPDYGGLSYWSGQYRAGSSLEQISQLFAQSPEFSARYGSLDDAQFVERVYQNVLARTPDFNESSYWRGRLATGMTRGQMMLAFSESEEFRNLSYNEVYVAMAYAGMLRREPDPGGFAGWVNYMDQGNSGLAVVQAFLDSQEYYNRFYF